MRHIKTKKKRNLNLNCDSCGTNLFFRGGYENTGLCSVCCTGESQMLNEMTEQEHFNMKADLDYDQMIDDSLA